MRLIFHMTVAKVKLIQVTIFTGTRNHYEMYYVFDLNKNID